MAQEHENLSEKTGENLQDFLNELMTTDLHKGIKVQFFITKDQEQPDFSIKANPTPDQPGNGLVAFGPNDSITPKWRDLLRDVLDPRFPSKREKFLNTCLKDANFNEESTQANVLLLFEVARRRSDDTFYAISKGKKIQPIYTWKNANNAIEAVMGISNDKEAYEYWVSELITMFVGEAGRSVSGDPYYNRWNAWNKIKEHFNLEDDNDGMSEESKADEQPSSLSSSFASSCALNEPGLEKDEKGDNQ